MCACLYIYIYLYINTYTVYYIYTYKDAKLRTLTVSAMTVINTYINHPRYSRNVKNYSGRLVIGGRPQAKWLAT